MLHTPVYDVRTSPYCGPTAISAVTGQPISLIRDIIRAQIVTKRNGHARAITGVSNTVLLTTMAILKWRVIATLDNREKPSILRLGKFLDQLQMKEQAGPYIVNVTGHYYAVDQDEICDTSSQIPIEIHRLKRGLWRWVHRWWQFEPATSPLDRIRVQR